MQDKECAVKVGMGWMVEKEDGEREGGEKEGVSQRGEKEVEYEWRIRD